MVIYLFCFLSILWISNMVFFYYGHAVRYQKLCLTITTIFRSNTFCLSMSLCGVFDVWTPWLSSKDCWSAENWQRSVRRYNMRWEEGHNRQRWRRKGRRGSIAKKEGSTQKWFSERKKKRWKRDKPNSTNKKYCA